MKKIIILWILLISSIVSHAHPSWGIIVDEKRNIYFADIMHNGRGSVWKLTPKNKLELLFKDFHAHNVSLDAEDHLVAAHGEGSHIMIRLYEDGRTDTLYQTDNHRNFNGGNCAFTKQGEIIFHADHSLWKINKQQQKEKLSNHHFEWCQTIYADDDGNYYGPEVGDEKGTLIKINKNGQASVLATNLISKSDKPFDKHADILMGITKGCDGHMYVTELAGQRVIKILGNQKTETFYKSPGDWVPTGIDFFSGDAYILEYKEKHGHAGPRIVKVNEAGESTIIFDFDNHQEEAIPAVNENTNNKVWWLFALLLIPIIVLLFKKTLSNLFFKRNQAVH